MKKLQLLFTIILLTSAGNAFCQDDIVSDDTDDQVSELESISHQWDVSGYIKLVAKHPASGQPSELELDDLSIFLSKNYNQWFNPFIEAEIFAAPLWKSSSEARLSDGEFIFERLYNDFNIDDDNRIRVGKFLAPVGQWNLIHAAPLVWTIERPFSSQYSYSNYITGIEYGHSIDAISGSRIDVYFQGTNEFDPKPAFSHPRQYSEVYGASWTLTDDLDSRSSLDYQHADVRNSNTNRDTISWQKIWYSSQWDFDTQLIYTKVEGEEVLQQQDPAGSGWDGGGYIQARYHLSAQWNIYGRGERFHFSETNDSGNIYIVGARYRLGKLGNLNFEYRKGSGAEQMLGNSISISYNAMFRW